MDIHIVDTAGTSQHIGLSVPTLEKARITGTSPSVLAYSINDIVKITGLGRTTIYKAIKAGSLQSRKLGMRTLVLSSDLDKFLHSLPGPEVKSSPIGQP